MLPVSWCYDTNITNICTGRFCRHESKSPIEALTDICASGCTAVDITTGPVRLFCTNRNIPGHGASLCVHDNVIVLGPHEIAEVLTAVIKARNVSRIEAHAWMTRTIYRYPELVVDMVCAHRGSLENALLAMRGQLQSVLRGRLDLWWKLFRAHVVSANMFDSKWLRYNLKHVTCAMRPSATMLAAAHAFNAWAFYLQSPQKTPSWLVPPEFKAAILFEIGLLGIPALNRDHQKNRPGLPRDVLQMIAGFVLNANHHAPPLQVMH